ncbi:MAG: hypothetical protein R3F33_07485 [Planctomycetota bacterium]
MVFDPRLSAALGALLFGAACAAPAPTPAQRMRMRVQAALCAESAQDRGNARSVINERGDAGDLDALQRSLQGAGPQEQRSIFETWNSVASRSGVDEARKEAMCLWALAPEHDLHLRGDALSDLGRLETWSPGTEEVVRAELDSENDRLRAIAMWALARKGRIDAAVLDATVRSVPEGVFDVYLVGALDGNNPAHLPAAKLLAAAQRPTIAYHAQQVVAQIEGTGDGGAGWQLEVQSREENQAAARAMDRSTWRRVKRSQVHEQARRERIVAFGELHVEGGALREAQIALLDSFSTDPAHEALGFEPSVESVQAPVIEHARQAGMTILPMEVHWEEWGPQSRHGARDLEVAEIARRWLDQDPRNRLFLIRGEAHLTPGGFLVKRLQPEPMLVLSLEGVPWELGAGGTLDEDVTLQLGPKVYSWPLAGTMLGTLSAWQPPPLADTAD